MGKHENQSIAELVEENRKLREALQAQQQARTVAEEQCSSLQDHVASQEREIERLRHRLEQLLRRLYGRRSEKSDPNQLLLFPELDPPAPEGPSEREESEIDAAKEEVSGPKRRPRRRRLPKDLPRKQVFHEPAPEDCWCPHCQQAKKRIGEDVTEELEYEPASFYVVEHIRPKYACDCENGVTQAPAPPRPIHKGIPGPSLLAHVLVSKFRDHLPLNRQRQIFERTGVFLPTSTLCDWVGWGAKLLEPLVDLMLKRILSAFLVRTDDTSVVVVQNYGKHNKPRRIRGYLWPYLADDEVVFDFTLSRSREGPSQFLDEFEGYLQTDAYSGYRETLARDGIISVGCWAHCRRRFHEALSQHPLHASYAVALIRLLYRIESEAAAVSEATPLSVFRARHQQARPVLAEFWTFIRGLKKNPDVLPKSPLGEAVTYAMNQRRPLNRYVRDGRLHIDNNDVERIIRSVAIGRRNWLFAGSIDGGKRAAIVYSILETCRLHDINPVVYLTDIFRRLPECPVERLDELTPRRWKQKHREDCAAQSPDLENPS